MRLIFVNRYYWPDESATSLMLTDLAVALAARGHQVRVLTSRQTIDDAGARLPDVECAAGVTIERLYSSRFGRARLAGRAVDYFTFYLSVLWRLMRSLRRDDVVIAKTDPPLISVVSSLAAGLRRAHLVNWLQDVYPEVAVRLGVFSAGSPLTQLLTRLRNHSLRRAQVNVVVGERMRAHLHALLPGLPVAVIHNWSADLASTPAPQDDNPYRQQLNLADKTVFAYSGNLGRAHRFDALLAAGERLKERSDLAVLIIGGGAQFEPLRQQAQARNLSNWHFLPYQPRAQLGVSLGAADVHLVSLEAALEGLIVPSKLYGILAAGRPAIYLGDAAGETAQILLAEGCGRVAGDDAAMLEQIMLELAQDAPLRLRMGAAALRASGERYSRAHAVAQWEHLLAAL